MIIKSVRLHPFGGIMDRTLAFTEGLNIILGPNEAGKTTVFNSVQQALFTPAGLTPSQFKSQMKRFLPVGGGDTIRIEIEIIDRNNRYTLRKIWGTKGGTELILPDGSVVTEEHGVAERLGSLLGANEGTYKSVLMTRQTALQRTVEELKSDYRETVHTLGDILRRSILETDGVSVDRFRERIQAQYDEYASHWDFNLNSPEKGKRYKKKAGLIHEAYWSREDTRKLLEEAREYEEALDSSIHELSTLTVDIEEKERYTERNREIVEAAKKRQSLEKESLLLEKEIKGLKEVNVQWPVLLSRISEIKGSLSELEKQNKTLEEEKTRSELYESNKKFRERYERAKKRKEDFRKAEKESVAVKKLTRKDLERVREACDKLKTLEAGLKAGRLSLDVTAKRTLSLFIQKDSEPGMKREIKSEENVKIEAGARIYVENTDLTMEILSGEGNINEILENIEKAKDQIGDLFRDLGIDSYEKAKEINGIYETKMSEVEAAKRSLDDELNGESFEQLEEKVSQIGDQNHIRSLTDIVIELTRLQNKTANMNKESTEAEETVEKFTAEYGSHDDLLERITTANEKIRIVKQELETLPQLPGEVRDTVSFINEYEQTEKELKKLKDNELGLKERVFKLKSQASELSSEEYEKQLRDRADNFNDLLKKGETIARIKTAAENIVKKLDMSTYEGIEKKLGGYVKTITDRKYEVVAMDESLPEGFVRSDGSTLPRELLSTGTRDVLALALRLSMAEYFLQDSDGFLMMDDPLVNLDPERQKRAAEVIREFSGNRQALLFSCHPSHAELLGGEVIRL